MGVKFGGLNFKRYIIAFKVNWNQMGIYLVGFTAGQWSTKNNEKCSYCRCFILSQGCSKPGKILYLFLKGTYDRESLQKEHKNQNTKMSQHRESDAIYNWTKSKIISLLGDLVTHFQLKKIIGRHSKLLFFHSVTLNLLILSEKSFMRE